MILVSCESNNLAIEAPIETNSENDEHMLKSWGDGQYDILGFGYDITTGYMEYTAVKAQILNINQLSAERKINPFNLNDQTSYTHYSGKDISDITQKMSIDVCFDALGGFLGSFNSKFSKTNEYRSNEAFAYYSMEVLRSKYEISVIARELEPYFDSNFLYAINNWTPAEVVSKYGTHVLMNVLTGAKLEAYVMCEIESERQIDIANSAIATTFIDLFGLDVNFTYDRNAYKSSRRTRCVYETRGGKAEYKESGVKDIDETVLNEYHIDMTKWLSSTHTSTPIFLRTDGNDGLVPIYELINNTEKKNNLKNYINSHIKSKQPEIANVSELGGVREIRTPFPVTQGAGVTFGDIDKNGKVDMILMAIEDRELKNDGLNYYHYQIFFDVDEYGNSPRVSSLFRLETNMITWGNMDGSIAITDINKNGIPDIVFLSADIGLNKAVKFYYQVAFDISPSGTPRTISNRYSLGDILNSWDCYGTGVDIYDFNNNGIPDLLVGFYDGAGLGGSHFRYKIYYDFNTSGSLSTIQSQGYKLPVNLGGRIGQGAGVAVGDINKNGTPDLMFMTIDDLGAIKYNIVQDIDKNGNTYKPILAYRPELKSYDIGLKHQGADCGLYDLDKDGNLDILFLTMYSPSLNGNNSWRYVIGSNLGTTGIPKYWR